MNNEGKRLKAELKDRLSEALRDNRMRPIELSEKTGIPKSMISYYLSGKSVPKSDRIYKIACTLDVSEAWLMGFDVPKERAAEQKKNDDIVKIVAALRRNPEYTEFCSVVLQLSPDEFSSVKSIVSALVNK